MGQIIESVVVNFCVGIPVPTPSHIYIHHLSYPQHKPRKIVKPLPVIPVNRVGSHVNCSRGLCVMSALRIPQLAFPGVKEHILSLFRPMALQDGAVKILHNKVENFLDALVARLQTLLRPTAKSRHLVLLKIFDSQIHNIQPG